MSGARVMGLTALLLPLLATAATVPQELGTLKAEVDPQALRNTVQTLVGFGTRHTLSETQSESRGIGAARRWVAARFEALGKDCGGCLKVETPSQVVTGKRVPQPTEVMNVLAIQRGTSDPDRVVIISGHLDSRVSDVMDATSDAPGANDDGSGVAAVMEAARVLSRHRFAATIIYAVLSGEEQGLYGGKLLASTARAKGWRVEAVLNNDIIGNSLGQDGVRDNTLVRVMSEATRATETPEQAKWRAAHGGELDSPSRNLSRHLAQLAETHLVNFRVKQLYRTDRDSRGGDQLQMQAEGFPAVRLTEGHENYRQQHQNLRSENGVAYGDTVEAMDFDYLAQTTRLNTIALASLALAPAPPVGVSAEGAVTPDTTIRWTATPGATAYRVLWRETTAPLWQHSGVVAAPVTSLVLPNTVIDDWFFGVAAISEQGFESPAVFPGEIGSFVAPASPTTNKSTP